jgi:hypothetical protein
MRIPTCLLVEGNKEQLEEFRHQTESNFHLLRVSISGMSKVQHYHLPLSPLSAIFDKVSSQRSVSPDHPEHSDDKSADRYSYNRAG